MDKLIDGKAYEALEDRARVLSHENRVEAAWFLRGVTDALAGDPPGNDDGGQLYKRFYIAGYESVLKGRAAVEV